MKELTRFRRWADSNRRGRGLLCHLYEAQSGKQKQYYTKVDYAYFNLFCGAPEWIIKGTANHGIRSQREKTSQIPCLNCYTVDASFYEALERHSEEVTKRYEFGIILSKRILKNYFGEDNVRDIELWDYQYRPPPNECWLYDIAVARKRLWPFNSCHVVRIKIPKSSLYGIPIVGIPHSAIMCLLVKQAEYEGNAMLKLLKRKKWHDIEVFPLL